MQHTLPTDQISPSPVPPAQAFRVAAEALTRLRERVEFLQARLVAVGDARRLGALRDAEDPARGGGYSVGALAATHEHVFAFARTARGPGGAVVAKRLPPDAPWRLCVALRLYAEAVMGVVWQTSGAPDVADAAGAAWAATRWAVHPRNGHGPPLLVDATAPAVVGGAPTSAMAPAAAPMLPLPGTLLVDGGFIRHTVAPAATRLFGVVRAQLTAFVESGGAHPAARWVGDSPVLAAVAPATVAGATVGSGGR